MKKLLVPVILMMALLAGCGNAGNDSLVNKDYTIDSSDNNEPEVTTPVKKEEQQTTSIKKEEQQTTPARENKDNNTNASKGNIENQPSDDRFAYKIKGSIMDFDSVKGPYIIIDLDKMTVLDSTSKNARIDNYSYDGTVLTITLSSDEDKNPQTYVIDTSVKSMGKLPVS
ncbi:hypothetical protein [Eshraghiella crossota]|uniref:hypothetical protein n=1 Tax=Eshraghiella crossota TaxID=45851 RepID=UPI003FD84668